MVTEILAVVVVIVVVRVVVVVVVVVPTAGGVVRGFIGGVTKRVEGQFTVPAGGIAGTVEYGALGAPHCMASGIPVGCGVEKMALVHRATASPTGIDLWIGVRLRLGVGGAPMNRS